jgi:hypothetical protein
MKPKVYVETTVIGYLTSWPSGGLIVAARQKITRDWWRNVSASYELVASELVLREASAGDPQAVQDRLQALQNLPLLAISQEATDLANSLMVSGAVPVSEPEDALHIAIAVVNSLEYLVTWNLRHIANATIRTKIYDTCVTEGLRHLHTRRAFGAVNHV